MYAFNIIISYYIFLNLNNFGMALAHWPLRLAGVFRYAQTQPLLIFMSGGWIDAVVHSNLDEQNPPGRYHQLTFNPGANNETTRIVI